MRARIGCVCRAIIFVSLLVLTATGCSSTGIQAATVAPAQEAAATTVPPTVAPSATTMPATATAAPAATVAQPTVAAPSPTPPPASAAVIEVNFAALLGQAAQRVSPAVVQIASDQVQVAQLNQPFGAPTGVGSGFIYDAQGHILTLNHNIAGMQGLVVALSDGRTFKATLVGGDRTTDLAVLQITGSNLPVAEIGDATQTGVGDWVAAIGNAAALPSGPVVNAGIVSALGRTVQEPGNLEGGVGPSLYGAIQTDAAIGTGNEGGPLVNLAGQVIGILAIGAAQLGPAGAQVQGVGFAIAMDAARPIADQLVATGQMIHPSLGASLVPLNPLLAAQLGINASSGAAVIGVAANSPAAAAGLQPSDVVIAVDKAAVTSDSALMQIVDAHKPGDRITLTALRGSAQRDVQVTLGQPATP